MQKELEIKTFPTRQEILEKINKIIEEDYCEAWGTYNPINEENLLTDSLMDSFAYAMFWMNISQDYKIVKETGNEEIDNKASIDYVNWIDYKVYTVKDLIDRIEKCM